MMARITWSIFCSWTMVAGLGCTNDTRVGSNVGAAEGRLVETPGHPVPPSADVVTVWTVSSGSPDYTYIFGTGTSTGGSFALDLDVDPPADALNSYGVGIGVLVLLPAGGAPPEGRLSDATEAALDPMLLGGASRQAVIFKAAGATDLFWSHDFPVGYSCGRYDPARVDPGGIFEGFAPMDCRDLEIQVADPASIEFTNWT